MSLISYVNKKKKSHFSLCIILSSSWPNNLVLKQNKNTITSSSHLFFSDFYGLHDYQHPFFRNFPSFPHPTLPLVGRHGKNCKQKRSMKGQFNCYLVYLKRLAVSSFNRTLPKSNYFLPSWTLHRLYLKW